MTKTMTMPGKTVPDESFIEFDALHDKKTQTPPALSYSERLDAYVRKLAKKLDKKEYLASSFGLVDGMNISISNLQSIFSYIYANSKSVSATDALHDWMMSPLGFALTAAETVTLVALSIIGNRKDSKNSQDDFKRNVALMWPYMRDVMKAWKNGGKGVRSLIQISNQLGNVNINSLIMPLGIAVGVLGAANRVWYRHIKDKRKKQLELHAAVLADIEKLDHIMTEEERLGFWDRVKDEKGLARMEGYTAAIIGGAVDSLYLYLGLLGLASLAGPVFVPLAVFCIVQSVCCIINRVYEEYCMQRDFLINRAEIDLAMFINERGPAIQKWFARLQTLSKEISGDVDQHLSDEQRQRLQDEFDETGAQLDNEIKLFTAKRNHLLSLQPTSYLEAILIGIKNGLSAYSAYSSSVFFVATVLLIASAPFPPGLVIASVSFGIALLAIFVGLAVIQAYRHHKEMQAKKDSPDLKLCTMMAALKDPELVHAVRVESVESIIGDGLVVDPSPQFFFQDWFEVIRLAFSGPGKGSKLTEYALNDFQQLDHDTGHYRDPLFMQALSIVPAILCTIVLSLNGLVKGFGKDKGAKKSASSEGAASRAIFYDVSESPSFGNETPCYSPSDDSDDDLPEPQPGESSDIQKMPRASSMSNLACHRNSFFATSTATTPLPRRSATPQVALSSGFQQGLLPDCTPSPAYCG
ncbi:hypothetical protein [Legionella sp. CNM-4043-24]|uniref:hypothetical protein n=1 Tax=Legionella sp. CNM-4043-24 TaxID=3421646 RepID=UPI00403B2FB1